MDEIRGVHDSTKKIITLKILVGRQEIDILRDPRDMGHRPHIVCTPSPNRNIDRDGCFRHGQIVPS